MWTAAAWCGFLGEGGRRWLGVPGWRPRLVLEYLRAKGQTQQLCPWLLLS